MQRRAIRPTCKYPKLGQCLATIVYGQLVAETQRP